MGCHQAQISGLVYFLIWHNIQEKRQCSTLEGCITSVGNYKPSQKLMVSQDGGTPKIVYTWLINDYYRWLFDYYKWLINDYYKWSIYYYQWLITDYYKWLVY